MIRTSSFSAAGGHLTNEDAFALHRIPGGTDGWFIFLADGQGGRAGGARAARLACRAAAEAASVLPDTDLSEPYTWAEVLAHADATVAADTEAGFTTLIGLCVEAGRVVGASCGDSAAVVVCGGAAPRVLTANQFKNPPVGAGDTTFVPFALDLDPPWRILVMSDGVWKYASWDRVWDGVTRLAGDALIADLQTAARLKTTGEFPDDFTAVLLESE
jgi:serine/threonine protein phosphatase PrpC